MRRIASTTLALVAVAALVPAAASARVVVQSSSSFTHTSNALISGWWWLRVPHATATWVFSGAGVQQSRSGRVYLLFSPLVTNRANGGSGFARSIRVSTRRFTSPPGAVRTVNTSVSLYNPFRPTLSEDTHGVGYQTYGYASVSSSIWKGAYRISVTFEWLSGYQVAVRQDAVNLSYWVP